MLIQIRFAAHQGHLGIQISTSYPPQEERIAIVHYKICYLEHFAGGILLWTVLRQGG